MNAWINATINSITFKNNVKGTETAAPADAPATLSPFLPNTKIKPTNANTMMCPAVILAKRRIINEIGFVKTPKSSIGAKNIFIGTGTPGIQKMCPQ